MNFKVNPLMVTEAISHQGRSMLFKELEAAIGEARKVKNIRAGTLEEFNIGKIIGRHTGLMTNVTVDMDMQPNAWITPPYIDSNHALLDDIRRSWLSDGDSWIEGQIGTFMQGKESIMGTVDREKGRLTGHFTKISCPMVVTKGLLTNQRFTNAGIATIILHEVGHPFTYFEFFGRSATFNGALQASCEAFFGASTREDKLKIIKSTSEVFECRIEDADALANTRSKDAYITTFARSYLLEERKSSLGSSIYDTTLWESLADQFAMRQGAGVDGIQAMATLNEYYGGASTQSRLTHILLTLMKVILFFAILLSGGVMMLIMLFINPAVKIYDDPRARLDRMRRDLVSGLKAPKISAAEKAQIAEDIKQVDELIKNFNDKRGVIEFFYTSILPSGRKQHSQRSFQIEMEKLTANDLMVSATRLGNLTAR